MAERIVSLAPSATATIRELGAADRIVGRTEHGTGPGTVVGGWLTPDVEMIDRLEPDLVVTIDPLQAPIAEELADSGHDVVHFTPNTLADVLETIERVGTAIGERAAGRELRERLDGRIGDVRKRVAGGRQPTVYCEEWQEPPMVAGNWIPEVVRTAGGEYPWLEPGERSRKIDRETVEATAPEHVILHVCGRGVHVDPGSVAERGWSVPAIEEGNVTVMADHLLNQPAPTLVDGLERLADRLHPDTAPDRG